MKSYISKTCMSKAFLAITFLISWLNPVCAESTTLIKGGISHVDLDEKDKNIYYVKYTVHRRGMAFQFTFPAENNDLDNVISINAKVKITPCAIPATNGNVLNSFGKVKKEKGMHSFYELYIPPDDGNAFLNSELTTTLELIDSTGKNLKINSAYMGEVALDKNHEFPLKEDLILKVNFIKPHFLNSKNLRISTNNHGNSLIYNL